MSGFSLPHKQHLSIPEIATRWGCDISNVVHFIRDGMLQAAAIIRADGLELHEIAYDENDKEYSLFVEPWDYGILEIPGLIVDQVFSSTRPCEYFFSMRSPSTERVLKASNSAFPLTKEDILVTSTDIEEFEIAYDMAQSNAPHSKEPDPRARAGYEKTIGVLLRLYVEGSNVPRLGTTDSPNLKEVATDIAKHSDLHGYEEFGMSVRAIQGRLSASLKRLVQNE